MPTFLVVIHKTVRTTLVVEADTPSEASKKVLDYGMQEAISDFPLHAEDVTYRRHGTYLAEE